MRFRLRTLMLVTAIVPPATAFVVLHWDFLLLVAVVLAALSLWFWVSYSLARCFGNIVASLMG